MPIAKTIRTTLIASVLLLGVLSSAKAAVPKIAKVQVTESTMASQVEIVADTPLTYTYYTISSPPRAVVDIALADPSPVPRQIRVDSPLITGITLDRQETSAIPLTRVTISLIQDAYLSVRSAPEDKGHLLVTLVKMIDSAREPATKADREQDLEQTDSQPDRTATGSAATAAPKDDLKDEGIEPTAAKTPPAGSDKAIAAPAPAVPTPAKPTAPVITPTPARHDERPAATTEPAALPPKAELKPVVPTAGASTSSPVTITATGVKLSGLAATKKPRVFRLSGPSRLVIDIPGSKSIFQKQEIPCNRFGISKIRVGIYPDKVRFVFDAGLSPLPAYRIDQSQSGLLVTFGNR